MTRTISDQKVSDIHQNLRVRWAGLINYYALNSRKKLTCLQFRVNQIVKVPETPSLQPPTAAIFYFNCHLWIFWRSQKFCLATHVTHTQGQKSNMAAIPMVWSHQFFCIGDNLKILFLSMGFYILATQRNNCHPRESQWGPLGLLAHLRVERGYFGTNSYQNQSFLAFEHIFLTSRIWKHWTGCFFTPPPFLTHRNSLKNYRILKSMAIF